MNPKPTSLPRLRHRVTPVPVPALALLASGLLLSAFAGRAAEALLEAIARRAPAA